MYRLIQLYGIDERIIVDVDDDGYTSTAAAWAAFRTAPGPFFGVGKFDTDSRLADVAIDPFCTAAGRSGLCGAPAIVVDTEAFHPMCADCGAWHEVVSLRELSRRLGVPVHPAAGTGEVAPARSAEPGDSLSHRIARELLGSITDPDWREWVCTTLATAPRAVNGLLIGVGALGNREVLDLYPALLSLAAALPAGIHADLQLAAAKPRSPAGMAALRLGFPKQRQP